MEIHPIIGLTLLRARESGLSNRKVKAKEKMAAMKQRKVKAKKMAAMKQRQERQEAKESQSEDKEVGENTAIRKMI
jgi:hypothetical protein